jgi:hypothetical protein
MMGGKELRDSAAFAILDAPIRPILSASAFLEGLEDGLESCQLRWMNWANENIAESGGQQRERVRGSGVPESLRSGQKRSRCRLTGSGFVRLTFII